MGTLLNQVPPVHRSRFLIPPLTAGLWLALASAPAQAGIDFTPRSSQQVEDGFPQTVTYLVPAPGRRALVGPPAGWSLTGNPAGLECHRPDLPGVVVTLCSSPFAGQPPAFDLKGLELYRRQVLLGVPPGATSVAIAEEHPQPLGLFGWQTYEFVTSWEFGGQFWRGSTVFVTMGPGEAMVSTGVSPREAFATVQAGVFKLLSSWNVETVHR